MMSLKELSSKGTAWADLLVRRLKMAVAASNSKSTKEDIICTAKFLCDEYIEDRLIRSGLQLKERKLCVPLIEEAPTEVSEKQDLRTPARPVRSSLVHRKMTAPPSTSFGTFQNLRKSIDHSTTDFSFIRSRHSLPSTIDKSNVEGISRVLISVGEILETRHHSVYNDVFVQLDISVLSELTLKKAFNGVAKQIFADGVCWAKIVSLFAFSGSLAVECVANCANVFVNRLKSWTVQFIAESLCEWIMLHDGWVCPLYSDIA